MGEGNRVRHCTARKQDEALCFATGLSDSTAVFALARQSGRGRGEGNNLTCSDGFR